MPNRTIHRDPQGTSPTLTEQVEQILNLIRPAVQ
jgi:hypothetical protein